MRNDEMNSNNDDQNHSNRPRRPSPDTITYLRSLPIMLDDVDKSTMYHDLQIFQEKLRTSAINTIVTNKNDNSSDRQELHDEEMEFPISIAAAIQAIYEIRNEIASLACDEYGAICIETLCSITIPISNTVCRIILHSICNSYNDYSIHLATHRYGSHVLQTILQLSTIHCYTTPSNNNNDLALHVDAPMIPNNVEDVPKSTMDIILKIASSLHSVVDDLIIHICGSHCIRTILCILGGVDMITGSTQVNHTSTTSDNSNNVMILQRRGKIKPKKKKKKKINDEQQQQRDTSRNPLNEPRIIYPSQHRSTSTNEMIQILQKYTTSLTSREVNNQQQLDENDVIGPGRLQSWVCHTSAGPVITVLLQVWAYYEYAEANPVDSTIATAISTSSSTTKHQWEVLREQQLQWEIQQTTPDKHIGYTRPEPKYVVGSMTDTIVRCILCWRNDTEQEKYGADVLYGLAGEPRGSHCLETILRISPDNVYEQVLHLSNVMEQSTMKEYVHDNVSNFVLQVILLTIRTVDHAKHIFNSIEPYMSYILDPSNKRRWVLWRMVELAATLQNLECQNIILSMISAGFTCLHRQQQVANDATINTSILASDINQIKINKCISKLLNVVPPIQYGDRVGVDIAGVRIVHHMLRFVPDLCKDTIKGIMEISPNDIELLIKDPLASRCLFDELIQKQSMLNLATPAFNNAIKRLVTKMQGRWVSIATDRVGHHTVKKLFAALSEINDKKLLMEELIVGRNRMTSNSMGRNVYDSLELEVYEKNGEIEWINAINRKAAKLDWLQEIISDSNASSFKRTASDSILDSRSATTKKQR